MFIFLWLIYKWKQSNDDASAKTQLDKLFYCTQKTNKSFSREFLLYQTINIQIKYLFILSSRISRISKRIYHSIVFINISLLLTNVEHLQSISIFIVDTINESTTAEKSVFILVPIEQSYIFNHCLNDYIIVLFYSSISQMIVYFVKNSFLENILSILCVYRKTNNSK